MSERSFSSLILPSDPLLRVPTLMPEIGDMEPLAFLDFEGWLRSYLAPDVSLRRVILGCWILFIGHEPTVDYVELRETTLYRVAYERYRGDVPSRQQLHHACRIQSCVNPWHLVPLTRQQHEEAHGALATWFDYSYEGRARHLDLTRLQRDSRIFAWEREGELG